MGTLDFTGSWQWAPFKFSFSTALRTTKNVISSIPIQTCANDHRRSMKKLQPINLRHVQEIKNSFVFAWPASFSLRGSLQYKSLKKNVNILLFNFEATCHFFVYHLLVDESKSVLHVRNKTRINVNPP